MKILVLNSGSSSQKCCLYEIQETIPKEPLEPVWQAKVEWDDEKAVTKIETASGQQQRGEREKESREGALADLMRSLWSGNTRVISGPSQVDAVGHRIVDGGEKFKEPVVIAPEVKAAIARVSDFAPLHNRIELEGVEFVEKKLPHALQVAVFDTGFHSRMPASAYVYAGPYEWLADGIRRFGFHGINHEYCAQRAAQLLGREMASLKLVTCHLGNGCSLAAIRDGYSVDTTMGFTPLEGLVMGTRSGSIDPGILTYLMRKRRLDGAQIDEMLNKKSGLLGISGESGDMRQIIALMKLGHERAKLAFDVFIHRLRLGIGAMVAALGGMDALVFTGGIGENSPDVRAGACANFGYLNLKIDDHKNARNASSGDGDFSSADSSVRVFVIRAQEDWAIARECWKLISHDGRQKW
jgi:acetate kinase